MHYYIGIELCWHKPVLAHNVEINDNDLWVLETQWFIPFTNHYILGLGINFEEFFQGGIKNNS